MPKKYRTLIPEYIKDYVSLNQFVTEDRMTLNTDVKQIQSNLPDPRQRSCRRIASSTVPTKALKQACGAMRSFPLTSC